MLQDSRRENRLHLLLLSACNKFKQSQIFMGCRAAFVMVQLFIMCGYNQHNSCANWQLLHRSAALTSKQNKHQILELISGCPKADSPVTNLIPAVHHDSNAFKMMRLMLNTALLGNQDHDDSLMLCPLPGPSQLYAKHQQEPACIS